MPRENECYTCLSVILLDSIIDVDKEYYPQVFLKECKYEEKKKIMGKIKEELKLDKSGSESDNEFDKYQNRYAGLH